MTVARPQARRILIGAGNFADAQAAFPLVERLADELTAELGGILVEETILTEIAGPPKQRIVTSSGTLVVVPTLKQFRAFLDSDAKAFQRALSSMAHSRKWSFERRRGELISGLCEAAKGWDLLLLGYRITRWQGGRVVLIAPPAAAAQEAVRLTGYLARRLGTGTRVLSLALQAERHAHAEPVSSEDELLSRIGRMHASAVVLDLKAGPLHTYEQLRRVLSAARCPVVVLGAAQGAPAIPPGAKIPPEPNAH